MKKIPLILFLLFFIIVITGCNSISSNDQKITEEKAKQMVLDKHSRECAELEFISVISKSNKYIIQWEIDPLEEGKDSINKETGKMKMIESSRGTCRWK